MTFDSVFEYLYLCFIGSRTPGLVSGDLTLGDKAGAASWSPFALSHILREAIICRRK